MTIEKKLIEQLLQHPRAATIVKKANLLLKEEKERRIQFYNDITDEEKVEFINGEIIVHSPVKKEHNDVNSLLFRLLSTYVSKHQLGYVGIEKIMITLERNDYEPDLCFFTQKKAKHFKKGQSLFPAPDFIVEILSKGTAKNDRGIKFQDYEANRISEYLIIDPVQQIVELYRLNSKKEYELILKSGEGTLKSSTIKGFAIPIAAIFDETKNLETLTALLSN